MSVPDYPRIPPSWRLDTTRLRTTKARCDSKSPPNQLIRAACALALATHAGEDVYALAVAEGQAVEGVIQRDDSIEQLLLGVEKIEAAHSTPRIEILHGARSQHEQTTPLRLIINAEEITLSYDSALVSKLEAEWFIAHVTHISSQLATCDRSAKLSSLQLVPDAERDLLARYSTSPPPPDAYPASCTTLHSFVLHAASEHPSSPALQFDELVLSFSQLVHVARHLALHLLPHINEPGQVVPICIDKSPQMIISMLAVLLAGGAYLNLEPSFPEGRKRGILEELGQEGMLADIAVVQRDGGEKGMWESWGVLSAGVVDPEAITRDLLRDVSNVMARTPLPDDVDWPQAKPEDPAYVIYTSGTTGKPKGICVEHRNVSAFLRNYRGVFGRAHGERVLQFPSYSFDVSVMNIWDTLAHGATICMTSPAQLFSDLAGTILRLECTLIDLTPTVSSVLFEHPEARPREGESVRDAWQRAGFKVKVINTGGEKVEKWVRDAWMERGVRVVIDYGPTETTVGVISNQSRELSPPAVPIGRPTGSTFIYIFAPGTLESVPLGCIGEICVGGEQVTRGYVKKSLNEGVFIDGGAKLGRIYRTGDLGRFLGDGEGSIECLGRRDGQVKVNGLRIEIGEIEEHLSNKAHPDLLRGVVDKLETPDVAASLVAFLDLNPSFSSSAAQPDSTELQVLPCSTSPEFQQLVERVKQKLAESLPGYMVPRYWLPVNRIPTQGMGKTDRKSLRLLAEGHDWKKARAASRKAQQSQANGAHPASTQQTDDEWHAAARKAWAKVLRIDAVDIGDDDAFTRLGGDSIGFLKVVGKLREAGYKVSFKQLVDASTLADCARVLREVSDDDKQNTTPQTSKEYTPFSLLPAELVETITNELDTQLQLRPSDIEDVYPTAPSQDALLAASVDCTHYYAQAVYALDSSIEFDTLQRAISDMVSRYTVLRSCFAVLESFNSTVQIVLRTDSEQVRNCTRVEKISTSEDMTADVDAWLKTDREGHVFRWGRLSLAFAVFSSPSGQRKLAWSMHHAMSDGWTLELLSADLRSLCHNLPLPSRPPFSSIVDWWLAEPQASPATVDFWRSYLTGATPLHWPSVDPLHGEQLSTSTTEILHWSGDLKGLSKRSGLTPAIASRIAIAVALGHHASNQDVTLGIVRSGRDIEVEAADETIGPCVSVLPSRIRLEASTSLLDLTRNETTEDRRARAHQHVTLSQIAKICQLPNRADLFNILVTYQSLAERDEETPEQAKLAWPIRQPPERIYMPTNYTLSLEVTPQHNDSEALELSCFYDHRIIEQAEVARLLATIARVMDYITTAPCTKLGELKLGQGQAIPRPVAQNGTANGISSSNGSKASSKELDKLIRELNPIWASVLRLSEDEFSPEDSFASLGGDSISMMRLSVRLTKAGLPIPVQALQKLSTMRAQAKHLAALS